MGWGNDFNQPGIRWFVQKLNRDDISVTAVRIPTDIRDFKRDIIDPVVALSRELGGPILISHSMGAIAGRYVTGSKMRFFMSPYWGIPRHRRFPLMALLLRSLRWAGLPLFDRGYGPQEIGDFTSDDDVNTIPGKLSVRTIYQFWSAQNAMPELKEDDRVYYTRSDRISDMDTILDSKCIRSEYVGGHAFFTSSSREKTIHDILYDLRPARSGQQSVQ
jgi:hypothetical protein